MQTFSALLHLIDLDIGQPARTIAADKVGIAVDVFTRQAATTGQFQSRNPALGISRRNLIRKVQAYELEPKKK